MSSEVNTRRRRATKVKSFGSSLRRTKATFHKLQRVAFKSAEFLFLRPIYNRGEYDSGVFEDYRFCKNRLRNVPVV